VFIKKGSPKTVEASFVKSEKENCCVVNCAKCGKEFVPRCTKEGACPIYCPACLASSKE